MPGANADKSRQTSAGKSFFGRKLYKERPADDRYDGYGGSYDGLAPPGSAAGSRSSRYSKRSSIQSVDLNHDMDPGSTAPTAGVITSIPFESLPSDPRTPVPIDNNPRPDSGRHEPSPNHIGKTGGDFHQYPAWTSSSAPNGYASHPSGPRPPPHASNMTMTSSASGDRGARYQQWGRPGSSAANTGMSHNSVDSSSNSRTSLDQTSLYSSHSSNTRGSNYFSSSDSSSRTLTTSHSGDRNTTFPSGSAGRLSNAQAAWQASQNAPAAVPRPPDTYLTRPRDDRIVDQLFLELMHKRGWQNLPEQAKRQMLSYPASKKWTLVHQDRLTELQGEQKRRQNARQTHGHDGLSGLLERADEEGSPEWYVKKVMDDTITSKQLASLSVSLRTQPIR